MRRAVILSGVLLALATVLGCKDTIPLAIPGPEQVRARTEIESAVIAFTTDETATGYAVYAAAGTVVDPLSYDSLPEGQRIPVDTSPTTVSGLTANTSYAFVVVRVFGENESLPTGIVTATPLGTGLDSVVPLDTPGQTILGGQSGSELGAAVARAGDVNNDGIDDVIIGAPAYDSGEINEGASFLLLGSPTGLVTPPGAVVEGNRLTARMGNGVTGVGDLDGDGRDDVALGLSSWDGPPTGAGRLQVHLGVVGGIDVNAAYSDEGTAMGERLAFAVSAAGDIDGDTHPDVAVGAPGFTNGETNEGAAFIYYGGGSAIDTGKAPLVLEPDIAGAALGTSVAGVGDVDGNGDDDVLAGAPGFGDVGQAGEGMATLFLNTGGVLAPAWSLEGESGGAALGQTVAALGDVDGDGRPDVGIGAPTQDAGLGAQGRYVVLRGSSTGLPLVPGLDILGNVPNGNAGSALAGGDVVGDANNDIVVGASGDSGGGRVLMHVGDANLSTTPLWIVSSASPGTGFGSAVAVADVNGDGIGDVLVGAPSYTGTTATEGAVLVFFGPPHAGPDVMGGDPFTGTVGVPTSPVNPSFTDSAAGTTWTCTWTWGDGAPATTINDCDAAQAAAAEHAFAMRGRYLVRLRVENEYGLAGEAVTMALIGP